MDDDESALQVQIDLYNRTMADIMKQRDVAVTRLFKLRAANQVNEMLTLACRHLDPAEGVMRGGHMVDDSDVAALRKVLDYVSASLRVEEP